MLEKIAIIACSQINNFKSPRSGPPTQEIESPNLVVLAVGDVFQWHEASNSLPENAQITFADFSDVTADFLDMLKPQVIISCLVSQHFDFIDLGQTLQAVNFQGCFRIIAPKLPNPSVVVSEAQSMCPKLNIDFVFDPTVPGGSIN